MKDLVTQFKNGHDLLWGDTTKRDTLGLAADPTPNVCRNHDHLAAQEEEWRSLWLIPYLVIGGVVAVIAVTWSVL